MVAGYILLRLKTLDSRNFKCVSHPLVFHITAITTDNVEYLVMLYKVQFHLIYEKKSLPRLH